MKKRRGKRGRHEGRLEMRPSGRWLAIWMIDGVRRSQSTGETDRTKAERWLKQKLAVALKRDELKRSRADEEEVYRELADVRDTRLVQIDRWRKWLDGGDPLTFSDAWAAYEKDPNRKAVTSETLQHTRGTFERFVAWIDRHYPKAKELREVTPEIAREYAADIKGLYVPATYNQILASLAQIWGLLGDRIDNADGNPWTRKYLTRTPTASSQGERRPLTDEELEKVFEHSKRTKPPLYRLFMFLLYTGLRLGDGAQMRWENIDLTRGVITIMPQKTRRFKTYVRIPILPPLRAMLEAVKPADRTGEVTPAVGRLYRAGVLSDRVTRFLKTCGIETNVRTEVGNRKHSVVSAHAFRHTFVSKAANAGVPFAIVQSIVGHSTAKMLSHYFHENDTAAAAAFSSFPMLEEHAAAGETVDAEFTATPADGAETRLGALRGLLAEVDAAGDECERRAVSDALAAWLGARG